VNVGGLMMGIMQLTKYDDSNYIEPEKIDFESFNVQNDEHIKFWKLISSEPKTEIEEKYLSCIKAKLDGASFMRGGGPYDSFGQLIKYDDIYIGCVSGELSLQGNSIIMDYYISKDYRHKGFEDVTINKISDSLFNANEEVIKIIMFFEQGYDVDQALFEKIGFIFEQAEEYKQYTIYNPKIKNLEPTKSIKNKLGN
jgi:hypothetical protein